MKKKKRRLRKCIYDLIINLCLFGAIICLIIATNSYMERYKNQNVVDVVKQVLLQSPSPEEQAIEYKEQTEPPKLTTVDKNTIIINYLDSIKDNIITNDLITYEIINTWHNYEIFETIYVKEVTTNYYLYNVHIKLAKDSSLPVAINEKLSTDEYNIITLNIYIYGNNDTYIIKKIDPSDQS